VPYKRATLLTADNLSEENEERVICQESLPVDVHAERRRVTFDLTEQATNPTPKAEKRDEMADNLSEESEDNVICEERSAFDIHEQPGEVEDTWL
jgi:hypothetical protein